MQLPMHLMNAILRSLIVLVVAMVQSWACYTVLSVMQFPCERLWHLKLFIDAVMFQRIQSIPQPAIQSSNCVSKTPITAHCFFSLLYALTTQDDSRPTAVCFLFGWPREKPVACFPRTASVELSPHNCLPAIDWFSVNNQLMWKVHGCTTKLSP